MKNQVVSKKKTLQSYVKNSCLFIVLVLLAFIIQGKTLITNDGVVGPDNFAGTDFIAWVSLQKKPVFGNMFRIILISEGDNDSHFQYSEGNFDWNSIAPEKEDSKRYFVSEFSLD